MGGEEEQRRVERPTLLSAAKGQTVIDTLNANEFVGGIVKYGGLAVLAKETTMRTRGDGM